MAWIDSHAHLSDDSFIEDISKVIERLKQNAIERLMLVATSIEELKRAFKLQELYSADLKIDIAFGIHPSDEKKLSYAERLEYYKLYEDSRIKAIGEIGLDYYWDKDNKDKQKALFIEQIKLAKALNKPIIIHSRDAIQDTYDILKEYPIKGVLHCYSGSKEMVKKFLNLDMYISFAGVITFKNAKEPKEVVKLIPLSRLLIETDCPYLAPEPKRGKRNEPAFVRYTGEYIAKILDIDKELLKEHLNSNYIDLFGE